MAIALTSTAGGVVSSNFDTITVSTNDTLGYSLKLADSDTSVNLVSGANNITPTSGTVAATTTLPNNKWGWCVPGLGTCDATYSAETNNGSSSSNWAAIIASSGTASTLKTTATVVTNDTTTVWYAVRANSLQKAGTYTDSVTYTATAN